MPNLYRPNAAEAQWVADNKRYTAGRCWPCNVRWVWRGKPRLKHAKCPVCGGNIYATTHQFKAGPTIDRTPDTK